MNFISYSFIVLLSCCLIAIDALSKSHGDRRDGYNILQRRAPVSFSCSKYAVDPYRLHRTRCALLQIRGGNEEPEVVIESDRGNGEEKIAFLPKGNDDTSTTRIDHKSTSTSETETFRKVVSENLRERFADASISLQRLTELQKVKPIAANFAMEIKSRYGETTSKLDGFRAATFQRLHDGFHRLIAGDTLITKKIIVDVMRSSGKWMRDSSTLCINGDIAIVIGAFMLSLLGSSLGFCSFLYFVSVGYGASIGIIAVVAMVGSNFYANKPVARLTNLHTFMTFLWSLRLTGFLLHREFINWPQWHVKLIEVNDRATTQSKIAIWLTCASFYSLMMLPCIYRLAKDEKWGIVGKIGIFVQAVGLMLESVADYQKGQFKRQEGNRHRFCNVGIWNYFTHPNYLGEMIFWIGTWLGGIGSYSSIFEWLSSTAGLLFVLVVMKGAIDSLSSKHLRNYGRDETYLEFRRTHSILGPTSLGKSSLPL